MVIIVLSAKTKESTIPTSVENDISLDQISDDHPILEKSSMYEEGRLHMKKLIDYILSSHVSSVNLIASISVLSNICKQRPDYAKNIFDTWATLLGNKNEIKF